MVQSLECIHHERRAGKGKEESCHAILASRSSRDWSCADRVCASSSSLLYRALVASYYMCAYSVLCALRFDLGFTLSAMYGGKSIET